ncbi:MAG: hypothetical protein ACRC68_04305, partial [Clostridium sp.]
IGLVLISLITNYVSVGALTKDNEIGAVKNFVEENLKTEKLEDMNSGNSRVSAQDSVDINIIKSISTNKSEVNIGESIEFKVEVDEKEVNIYDISLGIVKNNKRNVVKDVKLNYNKETKIYTGSVEFDNTSPSGEWSVDAIKINGVNFDNRIQYPILNFFYFDNSYKIPFNLPTFNVKGSESLFDTTCPKLQGVYFDKKDAKIGDEVIISIKAFDNVGLDKTSVILSLGIDGIEMPGIVIKRWVYNEETEMFDGKFIVDKNMATGKYIIQKFLISDISDNFTYLNASKLKNTNTINIKVQDNIDITPPIFNSITVEGENSKLNDTVKIIVDAEDNESNIKWIKMTYLISGSRNLYNTMFLKYNSKTKKYEGDIKVNEYTPNGKWKLQGIEIRNNSPSKYTSRDIKIKNSKDLEGGDFYVDSKGLVDNTPIVIKSLTSDKESYTILDTMKFTLDVEENESGISNAYFQYSTLSESEQYEFFYNSIDYLPLNYNEETKKYEGEIKITDEVYKALTFNNIDIDMPTDESKIGVFITSGMISDFSDNYDYLPHKKIKVFNTDINLDDKTDILDLEEMGKSYNAKEGDVNWDVKKDFNGDKKIDIFDIVKVAKNIKS